MKILKIGQKLNKKFRGTCNNCGSQFEAKRDELKIESGDQREPGEFAHAIWVIISLRHMLTLWLTVIAVTGLVCILVYGAGFQLVSRLSPHDRGIAHKTKSGVVDGLMLVAVNETPNNIQCPFFVNVWRPTRRPSTFGDWLLREQIEARSFFSGDYRTSSRFCQSASSIGIVFELRKISKTIWGWGRIDDDSGILSVVKGRSGSKIFNGELIASPNVSIPFHVALQCLYYRGRSDYKRTINPEPWSSSFYESIMGSIGGTLGGIGSLLVGAVHFDRVSGIDGKKNYAKDFRSGFDVVPKILFCLASNFAMCFGWWRGRYATCSRHVRLALGLLGIGFPLSVWSWIILTDRLGV